jgi:hypothetical protein
MKTVEKTSAISIPIELNLDYPQIGTFDINASQDINQVVAWLYYFVITIAGMAVFAMLVWGGFTWLTSTGDSSKITDAKERIYSALLGLILILASFLVMKTINPELVVLKLPEIADSCLGSCVDPAAACVAPNLCHASLFECPVCCCVAP